MKAYWVCIYEKIDNAEKEIFGGQPNTTNNQMELTAAIEGLAALKETCNVELFTDSRKLS